MNQSLTNASQSIQNLQSLMPKELSLYTQTVQNIEEKECIFLGNKIPIQFKEYLNYFQFSKVDIDWENVEQEVRKVIYMQKQEKFVLYSRKEVGEGKLKVSEGIEVESQKKFLIKEFQEKAHFLKEYSNLEKLDNLLDESEKKKLCQLYKKDSKLQRLFYEQGDLSLHEYNDYMKKYDLYWFQHQKQLKKLVQELVECVLQMGEKNIYHGNIKPKNIMLVLEKLDQNYSIKLQDFQHLSFDFNDVIELGEDEEQDFSQMRNQFSSQNQRIQSELFQVGRTIQYLMLSSVLLKEEKYVEQINFNNNKNLDQFLFKIKDQKSIEKQIENFKQYYDQDLVEVLKLLLTFKSFQIGKIREILGGFESCELKNEFDFGLKILRKKLNKRVKGEAVYQNASNFREIKDYDQDKILQEIYDLGVVNQFELSLSIYQEFSEILDLTRLGYSVIQVLVNNMKNLGKIKEWVKLQNLIQKKYLEQIKKDNLELYVFLMISKINLIDFDKEKDYIQEVQYFLKNNCEKFEIYRAQIEIGEILISRGKKEEGIDIIDKVVEIFLQEKNKFIVFDERVNLQSLVKAYVSKGQCDLQLQNYNKSLIWCQKAGEILKNLGEEMNDYSFKQYLIIGQCLQKLENFDFSCFYIQEGLNLVQYLGKTYTISFVDGLVIQGQVFKFEMEQQEKNQKQQEILENFKKIEQLDGNYFRFYKCIEKALLILNSLGNEGEKKEFILEQIVNLFDKHVNGILGMVEENFLKVSEIFEYNKKYKRANQLLVCSQQVMEYKLKILKNEQQNGKNNKNSKKNQVYQEEEEIQDLNGLLEFVQDKLEIVDLKCDLRMAEEREDIQKIESIFDEISEKVQDDEDLIKDKIFVNLEMARLYVKFSLNLKSIISKIDQFLPQISQIQFPDEFGKLVFSLMSLNDKLGYYERAYQLLLITKKIGENNQLVKLLDMIKGKQSKLEVQAKEAKEVRILKEKKKKYQYLKNQKGENRSYDVVNLGINIASNYQMENQYQESEKYIGEVLEFQKQGAKKEVFPNEENVKQSIYASQHLQSPRSRSISPQSIGSIKGIKIKNNFSNAIQKLTQSQQEKKKMNCLSNRNNNNNNDNNQSQIINSSLDSKQQQNFKNCDISQTQNLGGSKYFEGQQNNKNEENDQNQQKEQIFFNKAQNQQEDLNWNYTISISDKKQKEYITKQQQERQAKLLQNRILESKLIGQIQTQKQQPLKFLEIKRKNELKNQKREFYQQITKDLDKKVELLKKNSSQINK
ncbi:Protein kinase-like domain [Pseudocohnilembus persalinus]|uniref:Protein kinase-like domain n=1 Tax=Pseudocohnilembus persalinus TaxID=266149 RepID=A0A0V0QSI2_PSEPJ|nr:Protein kinase-like domain [Pseudocohnilembus persalinus]|eukprot:KRX05278.1 Protein kinase-like domain [Pseudocohnilembus persalinus]